MATKCERLGYSRTEYEIRNDQDTRHVTGSRDGNWANVYGGEGMLEHVTG
jgi:hypothetical protein